MSIYHGHGPLCNLFSGPLVCSLLAFERGSSIKLAVLWCFCTTKSLITGHLSVYLLSSNFCILPILHVLFTFLFPEKHAAYKSEQKVYQTTLFLKDDITLVVATPPCCWNSDFLNSDPNSMPSNILTQTYLLQLSVYVFFLQSTRWLLCSGFNQNTGINKVSQEL